MFQKVKKPFKVLNYDYPTKEARWIDRETGLRKNFDGSLEKPQIMKFKKKGAYTKLEKKVAVKAMYDAGWGSKRLSQWFKVGPQTVIKWTKMPTPEALKEFESRFKAAMLDMDMEATFSIKSRIMNLIPNEEDLNKLVKAGEYFAGEREKRVTQTNTQVNIYSDMLKRYGEGKMSAEVKEK